MQTKQQVPVSHKTSAREPQPMSVTLSSALAIATNALGSGDLTNATLSTGVMTALETRLRELTVALEPPRPDKVRSIIAGLGTMPSRTEDDPAVQRFTVDQFFAVCCDVPEWALESAAWAFLKNEAGSIFRPSAGEFRAFAMRKVHRLNAERHELAAVLRAKLAPPAKPVSAEDRKKLGAMLREAVDGFRMRDIEAERERGVKVSDIASPKPEPGADAARKVAEGFQHLQRPLTVSSALMASNAVRNQSLAMVIEDAA
jgi:hypothetical protein